MLQLVPLCPIVAIRGLVAYDRNRALSGTGRPQQRLDPFTSKRQWPRVFARGPQLVLYHFTPLSKKKEDKVLRTIRRSVDSIVGMTSSSSSPTSADGPPAFFPSSVEEAGALLGMSITQFGQLQGGSSSLSETNSLSPPAGMHSSFRVVRPVPNADLMTRLYQLRALLRSTPKDEPLVAAPSLLAVLIKLLGVSSSLAPAYAAINSSGGRTAASASSDMEERPATPPMLSNSLRSLWVDCVTLCHIRGAGLTGHTRINTTQFIRQMIALAATNPRSGRAAGGVRTAALDIVTSLLTIETEGDAKASNLITQVAPWALDILQVCLKALRSAGNGEATYRRAATETAIATAVAARRAYQIRQQQRGEILSFQLGLCLKGALEDKAIAEAIKFLKQAVLDKLPEVRLGAARFAGRLAPLLVSPSDTTSAAALEEVLTICWRNLDDESAFCADQWAEAMARTIAATLQYQSERSSSVSSSAGSPSKGASSAKGGGSGNVADAEDAARRRGRTTIFSNATTLKRILQYLVEQFVKVGGELVAARMGGAFSIGGRGPRVGISLVIAKLLQLRRHMGEDIGNMLSTPELLYLVMGMLGPDMEKQLQPPDTGSSTLGSFGTASRNWSKADAGVARATTSRILRLGIAQVSSEPNQLAFLQDLIALLSRSSTDTNSDGSKDGKKLNADQLQCALVEISHLLATLGEGAMAQVNEALQGLKHCLQHEDSGVRHEAAVACHAVCIISPDSGREFVKNSLNELQMHHAQLMTLSSTGEKEEKPESPKGMRMFRLSTSKASSSKSGNNRTNSHQNAIHGLSLMVAMVVRELPQISGGLPEELAQTVVSVGEILVTSQFSEIIVQASESAACACVRAGYMIISGIMAAGPGGIAEHVPRIFNAWQKASASAKEGGSLLAPHHDLVCIDSILYSVVVFLKYCAELLLSIPEALTQITVLLEDTLPLLTPDGRLGGVPLTPHISARLESAKASLLESFSWLPSGSYPMAADSVFAFAAENIQGAVYSETSCSILLELLVSEDSLLDTCSLSRVKRDGQSGGAVDLDDTVLLLSSDFSHTSEKEAVFLLHDKQTKNFIDGTGRCFRRSYILGSRHSDLTWKEAPTPLHEVGMWRRPMDPSSSGKIRLVDAAIQGFAATFGLKSGQEQQSAMNMLEALVPQYFSQITRSLNASLIEQSKMKDENAPIANVIAVLLLCLQSLPLHESTHNVTIGLGPPWMTKAKDILLALLPSSSISIRRAAAEGLALLATLGVSEDGHFLQSTVLHSLDELRQGNKLDVKSRSMSVEPISAARAGSLLTLAFIQRSASRVALRRKERARSRLEGSVPTEESNKESQLPFLQMMTRILPSISNHGFTDYFEVRTFALHSFNVLLACSSRLEKSNLGDEDLQLLRKAVEVVEDNVCSAWLVASNDLDQGHESQKVAAEDAFLAVTLRLMAFVTPYLKLLSSEDDTVLSRFCVMTKLIMEKNGDHPSVAAEGLAFYETMAYQANLLPKPSSHVPIVDDLRFASTPFICKILAPDPPSKYATNDPLFSLSCTRYSAFLVQALSVSGISLVKATDMQIVCLLLARLESLAGCDQFIGTGHLRSMVVARRVETELSQSEEAISELTKLIPLLILRETLLHESQFNLRCLLFARAILSGVASNEESDEISFDREGVIRAALQTSKSDAALLLNLSNPSRWQTKTIAAHLASCTLTQILHANNTTESERRESPAFNPLRAAEWCENQFKKNTEANIRLSGSLPAFYLQELITSSCMSSIASLDHSELYSVQEASLHYLSLVVAAFSQIPDPDMPGSDVLHQYSQQIYSVVKHSLSSVDETQTEPSFRVFLAGCETLTTIVRGKMSTECQVLRRLIRPMVPLSDDISFGSIGEKKLSSPFAESNYSTMIKFAKIIYTGSLLFETVDDEKVSRDVWSDLVDKVDAFGAECALLALEGARLLHANGLSLIGQTMETGQSKLVSFSPSEYNADGMSLRLLSHNWPVCSRAAIRCLTLALANEPEGETRQACFEWLDHLSKIVLVGLHESISSIEDAESTSAIPAAGLETDAVTFECLKSVGMLSFAYSQNPGHFLDLQVLVATCQLLKQKILEPTLRGGDFTSQPKLIHYISSFLCDVCLLYNHAGNSDKPSFLSFILCPLDIIQQGVKVHEMAMPLLIASLEGFSDLVKNGSISEQVEKSIMRIICTDLLVAHGSSEAMQQSATKVLLACVAQEHISFEENKAVALQMARAGQWRAWGMLYAANRDLLDKESLDLLKGCFAVVAGASEHIDAFAALTVVLNGLEDGLVGLVLAGVGTEILGLLHFYGTEASTDITEAAARRQFFSEALKVVLLFYQQLLQDACLAEFIGSVFDTLLAVLRFNGLPNHSSGRERAEPPIGRLVAQAVLHIARTSPDAFKRSMGTLSDQDRQLLEFAVRGEMTGYAQSTTQAPTKKKLNLKSFKK